MDSAKSGQLSAGLSEHAICISFSHQALASVAQSGVIACMKSLVWYVVVSVSVASSGKLNLELFLLSMKAAGKIFKFCCLCGTLPVLLTLACFKFIRQ